MMTIRTTKNPTLASAGLFVSDLLLFGRRVGRRNGNSVKRSQRLNSTVQQSFVSRRKIAVGNNLSDIGCKLRKLGAVCVESVLFDRYESHDLIQLSYNREDCTEQCFCKKPEGDTAQRHPTMPVISHTYTVRRRYQHCKQLVGVS
jgi:hypothetical protein